ncbi:MAG: hypothetical protein SPK36_05650 [Bacilli bacterium]|nr:hypothetical protein [Bacilli bacterium]
MNEENKKNIVNNEYDYSNILPTIDNITYLVAFCDNIYNQFLKLIEADEEKNKPFKEEYKEYNFKKAYSNSFTAKIRMQPYNIIECKDIEDFKSAIKNDNLKHVAGLNIEMNLDFKRGIGDNLITHENSFIISFNPYDIKFKRKSNYSDINMTKIEDNIKAILNKFSVANCIFCDKS